MVQMRGQNIWFQREIRKIILQFFSTYTLPGFFFGELSYCGTNFPPKQDTKFAGSILKSYFVSLYLRTFVLKMHPLKKVLVSDFGVGHAKVKWCVQKILAKLG